MPIRSLDLLDRPAYALSGDGRNTHKKIRYDYEKPLQIIADAHNHSSHRCIEEEGYASNSDDDFDVEMADRNAVIMIKTEDYRGQLRKIQEQLTRVFGDGFVPKNNFHTTLYYTEASQMDEIHEALDEAAQIFKSKSPITRENVISLTAGGRLEVFGDKFIVVNVTLDDLRFGGFINILKDSLSPKHRDHSGWCSQLHISLGTVPSLPKDAIIRILSEENIHLETPYKHVVTRVVTRIAGDVEGHRSFHISPSWPELFPEKQ